MDCSTLSFYSQLSQKRVKQAKEILGAKEVKKILTYALFLLGVHRSKISSFIDMPSGSIRTLIKAIKDRGLVALEDQRFTTSSFKHPIHLPILDKITPDIQLQVEQDSSISVNVNLDIKMGLSAGRTVRANTDTDGDVAKESAENVASEIKLGNHKLAIRLPPNPIQRKVVLLTLLDNDWLEPLQVAEILDLSVDRTLKLKRKLRQQGIEAIIDKRKGQQQDYRFTPEIKAKIIEQLVLDIAQGKHVSGEQLTKNLQNRTQLQLSPRSVLLHLSKMGISHIKKSIPTLLEQLKKNF